MSLLFHHKDEQFRYVSKTYFLLSFELKFSKGIQNYLLTMELFFVFFPHIRTL